VLLGKDAADQAHDAGSVRKNAHPVGAAPHFFVESAAGAKSDTAALFHFGAAG
jgi:hypothetical protein